LLLKSSWLAYSGLLFPQKSESTTRPSVQPSVCCTSFSNKGFSRRVALWALNGAKCAIKELIMTAAKSFASVKLPESLVQQARDAAQPLRRSAAGQIEYWVTLGRVVEHSGLTVQEARDAIENYEAAAQQMRQAHLKAPTEDSQASELIARFLAIEADGSLAQRVREVVAENRSKARSAAP
jgi:hypothetical protein